VSFSVAFIISPSPSDDVVGLCNLGLNGAGQHLSTSGSAKASSELVGFAAKGLDGFHNGGGYTESTAGDRRKSCLGNG
jgi:hypothetical protein